MFRIIKKRDILIGDQISIDQQPNESCKRHIGFTEENNAVNIEQKSAFFFQISKGLYVNISKIENMSQLRRILKDKSNQFDKIKLHALFMPELFKLPLNSRAIDVSSIRRFSIFHIDTENITFQNEKEKRRLVDYFLSHEKKKKISYTKIKKLDRLLKR